MSQVLFLVLSPTLSKETFNCPRGESELVECHPLFFLLSAVPSLCRLGRHCPRYWKGIGAQRLVFAFVRGIGGLKMDPPVGGGMLNRPTPFLSPVTK